MRPTNYLPKPALLLSTLTALSLYGKPVYAQKDDNNDDDSTDSGADAASTAPAAKSSANNAKSSDPPKSTAAAQSSSANNKATSTAKDTPKSTSKNDPTSAPSSSAKDDSTASEISAPPLTTSSDIQTTLNSIASDDGGLTGLPTLTKNKPIPTYPAPTVPPTNNAPFMQHSSAPNGTVFIAVGAILGAFGLAILIWRGVVGFLLHRSVERAAQAQHAENAKAGFPAPPAPFYKYTDNASNMSLSTGRGVRRTNRGPIPSTTPSVSNLFFSPTAAASGNGGGNRGSTFLPSGFYAAGNSSPGGHEHSISMTNLRPDSSRGPFANPSRNTLGPSPPDSPLVHPRRDISSSSLNLNRPPSQRAPSAFLEDLLADDPSSLPPPHMPPSRHSGYSNTPSPLGSPSPLNRI